MQTVKLTIQRIASTGEINRDMGQVPAFPELDHSFLENLLQGAYELGLKDQQDHQWRALTKANDAIRKELRERR